MTGAARLTVALALVVLAAGGAGAADLRVLSAGAVKTVLSALADDFRRETGQSVTLTTGTVGALKQKLAAGEPADVIVATDAALAELARAGQLAGAAADVARVGVGVAVRQGDPSPDISTVDAFKRALLAARSLVYNDPASGATSGIYVDGLLDRLGLREALRDRIVLWPGGYACEALTQGRADLCVHQISEILAVSGVALVGPLPREIQKVTTYAAGALRRSAAPQAARAFVDFVARPAFRARFAAAGLDYQEAAPRTVVTLGTATPGGGFPVYGDAVARTVNAMDPTLDVQPKNTKGSTENVPMLEAGQLDLALVQGEVAHEALAGLGRPRTDLKLLAAMYGTPGFFVVRADAPYKTIEDLKGKPIAWGARGSGLVVLARYVLDGIGLDRDRDFQSVMLDRAGEGPDMVMDGRVAALWGGGIGWPGFVAVARGPAGARFIAPDAAQIARIQARHAFLRTMTVPAGAYPGQPAPIVSVGSWSFIMARPTLPEDVAYRVARALHRGERDLAERLPQARETTAANTVAAAPDPALLHPGALRYLREIGLAR